MAVWKNGATIGATFIAAAGAATVLLSTDTLTRMGAVAVAALLTPPLVAILLAFLPRRLLPELRRRAVFVTGCDTGFGHGAALALDAAGAVVFAGCLFPDGDGAAALRQKASGRLRVVPLDVTKDDSVAAAADAVTQDLKREPELALWAIVNNAGILKMAEAEWMSMDDLKQIMDVNLYGQIRVAQAFLPLLKASKGRIVNVISLTCRLPVGILTPYIISKYAFLGCAESMSTELHKFSISVHNIEPWIYATPLTEKCVAVLEDSWKRTPESIKETYGESYGGRLSRYLKFFIDLTSESSSKVHLVADAILDACLAENPQSRYVPGLTGKIFDYFSCLRPFVERIIHSMFFNIRK